MFVDVSFSVGASSFVVVVGAFIGELEEEETVHCSSWSRDFVKLVIPLLWLPVEGEKLTWVKIKNKKKKMECCPPPPPPTHG